MPSAPVVLAARDLVKDYDSAGVQRRALDGVTLDLEQGRFLAVMGPSGSGKSTLLHLLGGLDLPSSGEVLVDGTALSALSDDELTMLRRRRIGFVFQFFNLVPVLSVAENVALPAVIAGDAEASYADRLERVIGLVGLSDHRDKLPSQLSGGQQQRVAVARALFIEPAVLLADEPTGNLDSRTGAEVLDLLRQAQDELNQSIVLVTHDARAAATADEVLLLQDGSVSGRLPLRARGEKRVAEVLAFLQAEGAGAPPIATRVRRRPVRAARSAE